MNLKNLPKNIGKMDRNIRFAAGGILVLIALATRGNIFLTIFGLILVGSAYMQTCPAYIPLKINTMKDGEGES